MSWNYLWTPAPPNLLAPQERKTGAARAGGAWAERRGKCFVAARRRQFIRIIDSLRDSPESQMGSQLGSLTPACFSQYLQFPCNLIT